MNRLCRELDIPTPDTIHPESDAEVREFARTASFPVVLKGSESKIAGRGARLVIAQSADELLREWDDMDEAERANLMLQEYIPGGPETVWMFNGYFDRDSECRVAFTGRKLRQAPAYTGMTCLGVCLPNPEVEETTKRFMKAIGYRGVLDIGYRYDARDGKYKLLDVNPRVGATFRLFVDANGLDVVRALYLDLTGQDVPPSTGLQRGRKWVVEPWDPRSCLVYRRDGKLSLRQWLGSYRGVREGAWFARDDPRPFVMMCARLVWNRLCRLTHTRTEES